MKKYFIPLLIFLCFFSTKHLFANYNIQRIQSVYNKIFDIKNKKSTKKIKKLTNDLKKEIDTEENIPLKNYLIGVFNYYLKDKFVNIHKDYENPQECFKNSFENSIDPFLKILTLEKICLYKRKYSKESSYGNFLEELTEEYPDILFLQCEKGFWLRKTTQNDEIAIPYFEAIINLLSQQETINDADRLVLIYAHSGMASIFWERNSEKALEHLKNLENLSQNPYYVEPYMKARIDYLIGSFNLQYQISLHKAKKFLVSSFSILKKLNVNIKLRKKANHKIRMIQRMNQNSCKKRIKDQTPKQSILQADSSQKNNYYAILATMTDTLDNSGTLIDVDYNYPLSQEEDAKSDHLETMDDSEIMGDLDPKDPFGTLHFLHIDNSE